MQKGSTVWLKDFELTYAKKEVKNPNAFMIMVLNKEERLLTLRDGTLMSLKRIPA